MLHGIPEDFFKIYDMIGFNPDAFIFQQLLHNVGSPEMLSAAQKPVPVHYPVSRDPIGVSV